MKATAVISAIQGAFVSGRKAGDRNVFGSGGGPAQRPVSTPGSTRLSFDGQLDSEMVGALIANGQEDGDVIVDGLGIDRHGRELGQRQRLNQALGVVSGFGQKPFRSTLRVA